ncbi:30S ribosome-binding factor RbfA [Thiorhodospira sibirica]|uniref:30S ribosome-binding factor RbfA n=1 Tax=Thiorhodospira sibirica TaxID=154347 RepID=UPI00022C1D0E|nr:30S ribosome-binding factor RbfA [Thiorhodospira sibirica]
MPRDYARTDRVGDQIQRELAELLRHEVNDPGIGMITLAGVEVSRDFAYAKVYFSVLGDDTQIKASQAALQRASSFLRRELGRRIRLRTIPQLRFVYDDTQLRGAKISALIDQAIAEDRAKHTPDDPPDGETPSER